MRRALFFALTGVVTVVSIAPAARADLDPAKVRAAIQRGVEYLRNRQEKATGKWADFPTQAPGGVTALCTLALLNCGVEPSDPAIVRALEHLRRIHWDEVAKSQPSGMTYAVSLQTMVFCAADPKRDLLLIGRNARLLESLQIKEGEFAGCWNYGPGRGSGDNSNAQFAILALHEAERVGVKVNQRVWERALGYWRKQQRPDGSWYYMRQPPSTGSMTCAGLASVIIAAGTLGEPDAHVKGDQVQCCAPQQPNETVDRGLNWLADHFSVDQNPGGSRRERHLYYLYALERVGRMTAQRWIGTADWFREGTDVLVNSQNTLDGSWVGTGHGEKINGYEMIGTSFALLFLSKGRRPIVAGKFQHGDGNDWNRHRHDLDNLTRYVEPRWKMDLSWQVVKSRNAKLDDLRQTPVLFISGKEKLDWDDATKKLLRAYVDAGGFILAENCCEGTAFDESFREFITEMFPEGELRPLDDPSHPIWSAEEAVNPKFIDKHPLWALNAGCRIGVVYCPKNLGCYWELGRPGRDTQYVPAVQEEIDFCFKLGLNVLAYATSRRLKFKYEVPTVAQEQVKPDGERGTIHVAKLKHTGGCDEAPYALRNLLEKAAGELGVRVSTERRLVPITDEAISDYHFVFMHGRRDFQLTASERKSLKQYVERGGTVLADSINSNLEFAAAFRREMKAVFPDRPLESVAVTHPMITPDAENRYGVYDISRVTLREPIAVPGAKRTVKETRIAPRLETVAIDGRAAVIFSPYDLSCALETHESLMFPGYAREDAYRIAINALLYSLRQ